MALICKDGFLFRFRVNSSALLILDRELAIVPVINYPFSSGVSTIFRDEQKKETILLVPAREQHFQASPAQMPHMVRDSGRPGPAGKQLNITELRLGLNIIPIDPDGQNLMLEKSTK